jgi:Ca2+-transporting ATPase
MADNKAMADKALRVLAAAKRDWNEKPADNTPEFLEQELVFVGLTGMIDPVRPEVKPAIERCREAGIRPIMITGDHIDTAVAIAIQLGIITDKSQAITGAAMAEIPDEEFENTIGQFSVYARVQPEHKVRIVTTWKKKGFITAMTGDGVNDAPSIKSADIGIGMGITGTDVTKSAAGMVLQDDNFATIVSAVGEGRRIYDNIRKTIQFLLSSNLAEVVAVFIATIFGYTLLRPMHLLWINLIGDTFPAIALSMEEGESDLMKRKPRDDKESVFAGGVGLNVFLQGAYIGILTLIGFFVGLQFGGELHGTTMAFLTLSLTETVHSFNVRSLRHSVFTVKKQNKALWAAAIFSLVLTLAVVYIPPLASIFEFTVLGWQETLVAAGLSLSILPFVEVVKLISAAVEKAKKK